MIHQPTVSKDLPGFSWKQRLKSFRYAGAGILAFIKKEHNARLHLAATIIVILMVLYYPVSRTEIIALVFVVALVWVTEMINTAIERTIDFITAAREPQIEFIKDVAAGAVLISSIGAAITGGVIFIPKIFL
jgi:diacylglycerol kinase